MSDQIRQEDINAAAWAACDTFRSVMDAAGYKDYILVMLFLKYISDVWQDHYDEYRQKYGNNEERLRRRLNRERFILPEGSSFYALYEQRAKDKIGELINTALGAIEAKNREKLEGVFRNIDFNSEANLGNTKERNRRLKMLLEDFGKPALNMRPSRVSEDVIGNTYIYLIERFASDAGKKAGEFYTPHKVSELVAKLCAPKPGTRICDPACGSAGLLVEAARAVGSRDYSLYGMEVNGGTWALARMNMFLHSIDAAHIERCNTLTDPALVKADKLMKFHSVVANPPFSLKKWGAPDAETDPYRRFWRGLPPQTKGDYAFISHMIEAAIEKEGRVVVVVPLGVLSRGGAEGAIRQRLIEENLLDAVIGLPGKLFPTTSIAVAILVFDRSREKGGKKHRRKDVLFIDASKDYEAGANQNKLLESNLDKILKSYKARRGVEKYAHVANIEEIRGNGFRLNIPLYVDTVEEEVEIDVEEVEKDIRLIEKKLSKARGEMRKLLKGIIKMDKKTAKNLALLKGWREVKLGEIAEILKATWKVGDKQFPYIGLEHIEENTLRLNSIGDSNSLESNKYKFKSGDILFGKLRPYLRKVVKPNFDGVCSTDIWVIRAKENIDTCFMFYFFANRKLIDIAYSSCNGTRMPRADWIFLSQTVWNIPLLAEQRAIASLLEKWDTVTEKTEMLIVAKEKQFKWLLKTLIGDQQNNPEWRKLKLGEVCKINKGEQLGRLQMIKNGKYSVQNGGISPSGNTDKWNTPANTVTISEGGNSCGYVNLMTSKFWAGGHCYTLANLIKEIDVGFLYYILKERERFLMKLRVGSALPNIQKGDIENFSLFFPSLVVQKRINRILNRGSREIDLLRQIVRQYRKQRDGLARKLLMGEWRVQT